MSIVLNEVRWAHDICTCASPKFESKPFETLTRVAKYYKYGGMPKEDARDALDSFLLKCKPDANTVLWAETLDRAVKAGYKYPILDMDSIKVTEGEMAAVKELETGQLQRLAFTLVCLRKYWDAYIPNNNGWVRSSDSDIMRMANIRTSIKRQCALFKALNDKGYIKFSRQVDNLNVQVLIAESGEDVLEVSRFDNLGYQYLKSCGDPYYYECCSCGITEKRKDIRSRPPKYCPSCAGLVKARQTAESDKRRMSKKRTS